MGKFDGVLLASDYDNTLIYTEPYLRSGSDIPAPSPRTLEALHYFMDNGGLFTVSTGRALAAFSSLAESVPMNAPAVLCNGAVLYDFRTDTSLETKYLPAGTQARVQPVLDAHPALAAEAYHIGNTILAAQPNDISRHHVHITHVEVTEVPSLAEVPDPLGKLLFEAEHEELLAVRDWFDAQPWIGEYELVFSRRQMLELTARDANKGGMVLCLAQRLGISPEHVYCAGDEANDISMLVAAREGFAPANCTEPVRACGATIVSDAEHDAVADIIDILDRRYS